MEARLTWLVKPVRPVTMISWGGEWVIETKMVFLVGPGCRSPVLRLGGGTSLLGLFFVEARGARQE
jgi:hypothetical protein